MIAAETSSAALVPNMVPTDAGQRGSIANKPRFTACPGGGIGRHRGLKIPRPVTAVRVRVPPWALSLMFAVLRRDVSRFSRRFLGSPFRSVGIPHHRFRFAVVHRLHTVCRPAMSTGKSRWLAPNGTHWDKFQSPERCGRSDQLLPTGSSCTASTITWPSVSALPISIQLLPAGNSKRPTTPNAPYSGSVRWFTCCVVGPEM